MTQQEAPPPAIAVCPSCAHVTRVDCIRDPGGVLHPCELSKEALLQHAECNLWELLRELSRAALNLSRVQVFSLKGGRDVSES
jgi:hypothetical protein